ncbi:DUF1203 domain-containing protein [Pedobacter psychrotolerans]|nr:DUF1203 domain-containing protein [Pedobacter psychrotolerans]
MKKFKIVPISAAYANNIKRTLKDNFGHDVIEQVAAGFGPCRVSLKPFIVGIDIRLLFTHSPFTIDNVFNQPGPVFIHQKDVEPYRNIHQFPPEIKADKEKFPLSLIGYSKDQQMMYTQLIGDADVDHLIGEIFDQHTEIDYLHARNAEACCYICKIERV